MPVFRVEKNKNYTTMANYHLQDTRLSLKAKGLLSLILSLPEDWDYTIPGLAARCRDGKDAVRSCLDELGEAGYIRRGRTRREDGTYGGNEYVVYEHPQAAADEPSSENPTMDEPSSENPTLENPALDFPTEQNTNRQSTKITNIPPVSPAGGGGKEDGNSPPVSPRKGKRDRFDHKHEAYRCAVYLDGQISARLPGRKPSDEATLQRWAADFDKCHRIDGYSWNRVMNVLMFSQRDSFWQSNILSAKKFRAKFDMLFMRMLNEGGGDARAAPSTQPRVLEREGVREI